MTIKTALIMLSVAAVVFHSHDAKAQSEVPEADSLYESYYGSDTASGVVGVIESTLDVARRLYPTCPVENLVYGFQYDWLNEDVEILEYELIPSLGLINSSLSRQIDFLSDESNWEPDVPEEDSNALEYEYYYDYGY